MTDLLDEWRRLAEAHLRVGGGLLSPLSVFLVNHSDELLALAMRGREAEQRLVEVEQELADADFALTHMEGDFAHHLLSTQLRDCRRTKQFAEERHAARKTEGSCP